MMTADTATITERLSTRAKAFVSDPELVTPEVLALAVNEALELAGAQTVLPVLVDIAFYRLLLQLGHHVDENDYKAYQVALRQISDPASPAAPSTVSVVAQAKPRTNPYQ